MTDVKIKIGDKEYPCRQTMGAMLRFKRETGRDVSDMELTSVTDQCTFLWCCIASASKADGVDFNLSLMDFADSVGVEVMTAWAQTLQGNADTTDDGKEKKSSR